MALLTLQRKNNQTTIPSTAVYTSRMIRAYQSWLYKQKEASILDLGPTCSVTINTFLPLVKKVFINDYFHYLSKIKNSNILLKNLDYRPNSFNAIHFWDLIDHLDNKSASLFVEKCYPLLKPSGSIIITAYNEFQTQIPIVSFAISNNYQVTLKKQIHLKLPYFYRHNRDLIAIMKQFNLSDSFLYQNGIREFIFRRA